jgi:hypothetical protein
MYIDQAEYSGLVQVTDVCDTKEHKILSLASFCIQNYDTVSMEILPLQRNP